MKKVLAAVLAIGAGVLASGTRFTADPTAHFPRSDPEVAAWLELSQRFDAFNTLIVGLEEPGPPLAGLPQVKAITARLTAMKADGVLAVASVTNVESVHEGVDGSLETDLLVSGPPDALAARIAADGQVSGVLISRDQRGYSLVLRADPRKDADALAAAIRAAVEAEKGALTATYFGAPYFQAATLNAVRGKLGWLVPGTVVTLLGLLALTLRRPRAIATVLLTGAFSVVVWFGLVRALTPATLTVPLGVFVFGCLAATRPFRETAPRLAACAVALLLISNGLPLALGLVAVLAVSFLVSPAVDPSPTQRAPAVPLLVALAILAGIGATARFHVMPQDIFEDDGEVARTIAFFDRRFGGPDFVQLDFRGDLRDPAVAARLLRLDDLLDFPDVRGVGPILAFLNHGFGGVHRIPPSRESLNNLWFFLEGRPDVRNLVSEQRDEAMVLLRVPSKLPASVPELRARVDAAVKASLLQGREATVARLRAIARRHALPVDRLDAVLDGPAPDVTAAVTAALHAWLFSAESPVQPTEEQWARLAEALPKGADALAAAATGFEEPKQLADTLLGREKDLRLALRALALADALWPNAPADARTRAQGVFADHLEPQAGAGEAATIAVTGLPVIAPRAEQVTLLHLFLALGILVCVAGGAVSTLERTTGPVLTTAVAAAAPLAVAAALGPGIDPGALTVFLLVPCAALIADRGNRATTEVALAFSAALVLLAATRVLPVARIGVALGVGLAAIAAQLLLAQRTSATSDSDS